MIHFSEHLTHGSTEIPFFNDSANNIAPKTEKIISYAKKLEVYKSSHTKKPIEVFNDSGFYIGYTSNFKLIFKVGSIKSNYQPGHSHADSLSFELSAGNTKIFTNSGISHYAYDDDRLFQRSSKAHNNVVIDNEDSSEVWGSFRVGKRAKILHKNYKLNEDNNLIEFSASHDGFSKFLNRRVINREIKIDNNNFYLSDTINGGFNSAFSYIYLHPSVKVSEELEKLVLFGKDFKISLDTSGIDYEIKDSLYYPEFGVVQNNKLLKIRFERNALDLKFQFLKI